MQEFQKTISRYRWTICALLFFATTVNYLDRQVLSLLKGNLEVQFNWSDSDYANIVSVFQFVYAISMIFVGRIIDWLGTKLGFAWSLIVWSTAAMAHALARGTGGFIVARGLLGFGESGCFPAANKTNAEWFPKKERAQSFGILNSGTNVGAILAPIVVPWIVKHLGWQAAFIIVGGIGFTWLIFWFWLYEIPSKSKRISKAEYDYIHSDDIGDPDRKVAEKTERVPWFKLLQYKQTWAFSFGKFMTDGVWWFYLFWLPAYLKAQYNMTGIQVAFPLAVLYTLSTIGSITGGSFPMLFIKKGYDPYAGRMKAMLIIALVPLLVLSAQYLGTISYWMPVIIIGIGTAAHQAWSANIFTTVSDMFPKKSVASITGIGGMAGGFGGILINKSSGWIFDGFRSAGIARSWIEAQGHNLGEYLDKIRSMNLVNRYNDIINLDKVELSNLPTEIVKQLQAVDPNSFDQLKAIQMPLVQQHLTTGYTIVFVFCAVAYLIAWIVMHKLVPKMKKIDL
jgi:MFS transporter, ACS family, aldohexuronate transporter